MTTLALFSASQPAFCHLQLFIKFPSFPPPLFTSLSFFPLPPPFPSSPLPLYPLNPFSPLLPSTAPLLPSPFLPPLLPPPSSPPFLPPLSPPPSPLLPPLLLFPPSCSREWHTNVNSKPALTMKETSQQKKLVSSHCVIHHDLAADQRSLYDTPPPSCRSAMYHMTTT